MTSRICSGSISLPHSTVWRSSLAPQNSCQPNQLPRGPIAARLPQGASRVQLVDHRSEKRNEWGYYHTRACKGKQLRSLNASLFSGRPTATRGAQHDMRRLGTHKDPSATTIKPPPRTMTLGVALGMSPTPSARYFDPLQPDCTPPGAPHYMHTLQHTYFTEL